MYAGPCELNVPTSGTRDRRLRGYLVSFARCPRVETDLAAPFLSFILNLDQSILDAIDLAYLPVVLEITGYATIYSVLCAAPGLKPIWLPETGAFLNVDLSRFSRF